MKNNDNGYMDIRRTKFLIELFFVLLLILFMPSIPAIQQKTIEDNLYNKFIDDTDILEDAKLPLLYALVMLIYIRGIKRIEKYYFIFKQKLLMIYFFLPDNLYELIPKLTLFWDLWWFIRVETWINYWIKISEEYNLGWTFEILDSYFK